MDVGDDGRIRKGGFWSALAHAFTAIVGSGILALPWSIAQLGWIVGPIVLFVFAGITYYAALLLCDCYRTPDPVTGRRNYTYIAAVRALLGWRSEVICGIMQYLILWGTTIGYTITTAVSIATIKRSTCFHDKIESARCGVSGNMYMMIFGLCQILLSQCPNLEKVAFLSVLATMTSLAYAVIALALSVLKLAANHQVRGSLMLASGGASVALSTKVWGIFSALGNIAFAYTYSMLLLEIQDTLKPHPPENKVMKKVTAFAMAGTTIFYVSLGCFGYAAFGSDAPGNVLSGFNDPFWLVNIANVAVIIHLFGAYQVFAQPIYAIHEKWVESRWPNSFMNYKHKISLGSINLRFTFSRLLLRPSFVVLTTILAMMFPFFNAILSLLGSISFWPLTIYFPINMYMVQAKIKRGSSSWIGFQCLSAVCLSVTIVSVIGSIAGIIDGLKHAKLFHIQL